MAASISNSCRPRSRNFDLIKDSMLQSDELPLTDVVVGGQWQEIFDAHEIDFGTNEEAIYTPAVTLWALISQVFFKGEMQSSAASVRMPRTFSFTTGQLLVNNWLVASVMLTPELVELGQQTSASEFVGHRPDRVEPRANKRRPKLLSLLTKPRSLAKLELICAA